MWHKLSWRVKIPLAITTAILFTELVVTTTLLNQASQNAQADLRSNAQGLSQLLSHSLREPLVRDDLWQSYEIIRTPTVVKPVPSALKSVVVTNQHSEIFVSTDPLSFPLGRPINQLIRLQHLANSKSELSSFTESETLVERVDNHVVAKTPILSEDRRLLGFVILLYDADFLTERLLTALNTLLLVTLPGLLILIPLGWWLGNRLVKPLSRLAEVVARVGNEPSQTLLKDFPTKESNEIGLLFGQIHKMLLSLAEKESLEKAVIRSERLAAIGSLTTAIAHEIKNPLTGMLTAIDTASKHGRPDAFMQKTLGLLERGLNQIRTTVSALLVEGRVDSPSLTDNDWHDLRTLISPQLHQLCQLHWAIERTVECSAIELPAHEVRQITLNLLLNAVEASNAAAQELGKHQHVTLEAFEENGSLHLRIENTGAIIDSERLRTLFEPFSSRVDGGATAQKKGLGLWIVYQLVQRLSGKLEVSSKQEGNPATVVDVWLPLKPQPSREA